MPVIVTCVPDRPKPGSRLVITGTNDEIVRVPLILRFPPAIPAARAVDEVVGLVDLAPGRADPQPAAEAHRLEARQPGPLPVLVIERLEAASGHRYRQVLVAGHPAGALVAWLLAALTGFSFRIGWAVSSLLLFIVPGGTVYLRELRRGKKGRAPHLKSEPKDPNG